jgi:hypothetical protein
MTPEEYGSYSTFNRAFDEMVDDELVQLMGGKGSFNTCSICNHALAIKKAAARVRDRVSIEIVRKLLRQHLKQQQIERQHAETYIHFAKHLYGDDGQPERFYICIDGMTAEKTMAPVMLKKKDRKNEHPRMENRNMGARIVCGPIDEFVAICTGNLIPGGANVLIECTRIAIEILAQKLGALDSPLVLPKTGGLNYDNCGENKVIKLLLIYNYYIIMVLSNFESCTLCFLLE